MSSLLSVVESMPGKRTTANSSRIRQLDAVRGFAATYVFVGHVFARQEYLILKFGQEAVMLFFILSGVVIYRAAYQTGESQSLRKYVVHRFRRIYTLFAFSLFFTYVCTCIELGYGFSPLNVAVLLGNLAMFQDNIDLKRGVWFDVFGGNTAMWSLSYEWWFYWLFYLIVTNMKSIRGRRWVAFAITMFGSITYQLWPNFICLILGYLYIWWSGAEIAREYIDKSRLTWRGQCMNMAFLFAIAVAWSGSVANDYSTGKNMRFGTDPFLQFRHACSAFAILGIGVIWYKYGWFGYRYTLGIFEYFAPISYGIYIFHIPTIRIVKCILSSASDWVVLPVAVSLVIPLAFIADVTVQRRINRILK